MKEDEQTHFVNLLLAEYEFMSNAYLASEELGERRVNFFITLTTAILAALVALTGQGIPLLGIKADPIFFVIGAGILILFGILTLIRIIYRNLSTDKYKQSLDRIRAYFVSENDQKHLYYLPFNPYVDVPHRQLKKILSFGTGGLVQTVALMNSLIVTVSILWVSSLVISFTGDIIQIVAAVLLSLSSFILIWTLQMIYVRRQYNKALEKAKNIEKN